jgi:hypothetical protein
MTFVFSLLVVIVLGWFIYRVFYQTLKNLEKEVVIESESKNLVPVTTIPLSLKTSSTEYPKTSLGQQNDQQQNQKKLSNDDDHFEIYDQLEESWLKKVQSIIGAQHFKHYQEMRERNEKEKMQAYKEYHDYLRQKYGDKFSYNISEDQSIREKKINQRYLKELLKLIGPQMFKDYVSAKDQFNEKMRKNKKEAIQLEF